MNSNKTQRKHKFSVIAILLVAALILQGCVVFLSSVAATVVYVRSKNHLTTTVLIKKSPDEVYAAMNKIIDRSPDVKVLNREDKKYLIEASRGKDKVTAKATLFGSSGLTQLIVIADAGERGQKDEDLALRVVRNICEELKVDYKVVDG